MGFLLVILVKLILVTDFLWGQNSCDNKSCFPSIGDLLVGRSEQLTASSTCGLSGIQKYCIIGYLEDEQKCFTCDSRYPYHPVFQANSHLIENVITTFETDKKKWWQSENGVDHVSIRLDLENVFQFSHFILTFKTFRPAAMLVERSADYGQTWKVFRYFAHDCAASFPNIPSRPAGRVGDVVCDSRYSDIEPSTEGEVVFKALDPSFDIEDPYAPYIQELITFTNLRINFTKLHTLGDTLLGQKQQNPLEKYYYALYEMVVRGSCFCNGHASYCGPVPNLRGDVFYEPGMVHGNCLCEHNTEGLSCERCKDFYNDAPWRPAEGSQENACQKCECNGHSESCHFDMAVYLSNNRISGGVCEDCQHNTMGQHCDQCTFFYYQDPQKTISDSHACVPCDCDPAGSLYNGLCEGHTDPVRETIAGQCHCKENVEGVRCDKCKPNCYGMSESDPLGCQPCNCDPSGSLAFSVCDPVTGECLCQQFATGQHCEQCLQGYWGLGSHLYGCSPCDCDIGGAHNNLCAPTDGQCDCLPNIVGRQCTEPAAGYFFLPLDYYIYEAEDSEPLPGSSPLIQPTVMPRCDIYFRQKGYDFIVENGKIILNRSKKRGTRKAMVGQRFDRHPALDIVIRESVPGKPMTWSGPGFVRVQSGAELRFTISNIPFMMDFNIIIRYEPESVEDWIANIAIKPFGTAGSEHCRSEAAFQEPHLLPLPSTARMELLPTPICLEPGREYFVDVYFSASGPETQSSILIDSLGLIPRINSVENLCNKNDLEEYQQYHCIEIASEIGPHTILPEACAKLIGSLSARIHNGAVSCRCHPQGSVNSNCDKLGGQCECKPNVIGRCCDKCSAGSYGFGSQDCLSCGCHPQGSVSALCDQVTGQCLCRPEVDGQQCHRCLAGYFGFPHCRPCPCNGFAELCDPQTGECLNCRGFTAGTNCERCIDGYYGNPLKREPCHPCMCPDAPTSSRYFAHSCYEDPWTQELVCNCLGGYSGDRCDECSSGFYGSPKTAEGQCLPCSCNDNIDPEDPDSCNTDIGECLKCLYNTSGPSCEFCKPGYFGSALLRTCRECNCNPLGVNPAECPSGDGLCMCDQTTGACPCLPNVMGSMCDQCSPGYWNMVQGIGCHICGCNPKHSQNNLCDQFTGQCSCKPGYMGRRCDVCDENNFGESQIHCTSCKCNKYGTLKPECDEDTGVCNCRTGVTGRSCDQCARGYSQEFPSCSRCHVCFDQWDNIITILTQKIQKLMRFAATHGDKKAVPGCDIDVKGHEDTISQIEMILRSPVLSSEIFLDLKKDHDRIRQKVSQMYRQPDILDQFPDLSSMMEDIRKDADHLSETLRKRSELHHRINYMQLQDLLDKIRNYYQITLSAGERINGTKAIMTHGAKTRSMVTAMLEDLTPKESIVLHQLKMFKTSDIQNLNEKICGVPGDLPCVVAVCGGALCQDNQGNKHCGGPNCNGALPLSTNAIGKAGQAATLLKNVTSQLKGAENKIENIRKMTEENKKKALQINRQLEKNKDQLERGENVKELIKRLKNFLLEESAPPEDIEKVANYVLGINVSGTPQELIKVLDSLKGLMTRCDDSATYVNELNKQVEEAGELLLRAQETENTTKALLNPDELISNLDEVEKIQGQTREAFAKLNEKIEESRTKISQTRNKTNRTDAELQNFSEKQSEMEEEVTSLKTKMQMNRNQVINARSEAEKAQNQAMSTNKDFADLKIEYANLQEKLKTKGLSLATLEKLNQLKKEAEELIQETEEKAKRISGLEKKIQDLNQIKQDKADQLKQLEDQVIAIKNEITEQANKYATCKS